MKKEIKLFFNIEEQTYTISYLLIGEKATISFSVRTPSVQKGWLYWTAIGIDIHSDTPLFVEQQSIKCAWRETGQCYCDGTSLGAQELWSKFIQTGEESVIWTELQFWYDNHFVVKL